MDDKEFAPKTAEEKIQILLDKLAESQGAKSAAETLLKEAKEILKSDISIFIHLRISPLLKEREELHKKINNYFATEEEV